MIHKYLMKHLSGKITNERDMIIKELSEKYASNKILLEDYERLVGFGLKIERRRELKLLKKIVSGIEQKNNLKEVMNKRSINNIFTIFSSKILPKLNVYRTNNFITIFGDNQIIFHEKDLINNDVIKINNITILGQITIYIPEGYDIVTQTIPLLSEIDINRKQKKNEVKENINTKRIIIRGMMIMGEIEVIEI